MSKGEVEPSDTREKAARSWKMVRRYQSSLGIIASLQPGIESVKRRGGGRAWRQSGSGDARWSDQINFCSFDSRKRVDFPSCEKVVKMIDKDLENLGIPQSGISVRQ